MSSENFDYFKNIDPSNHIIFPFQELDRYLREDPNANRQELLKKMGVTTLPEFLEQQTDSESAQREELVKCLGVGISEKLTNARNGSSIDAIFKLLPFMNNHEQGLRVVCIVGSEIAGTFSCSFTTSTKKVYHTEKAVKNFEGYGVSTRMFQYATEALQAIGIHEIVGEIKIDNPRSLNSRRWKAGILSDQPYLTQVQIKNADHLDTADTFIVTTKFDTRISKEQAAAEKAVEDNLRARVAFAPGTSAGEAAAIIAATSASINQGEHKVYQVELSEKLLTRVQNVLNNAREKLEEMGVQNARDRLPTQRQVVIRRTPRTRVADSAASKIRGIASLDTIDIMIDRDFDLESEAGLEQFEHVLAHEIAHFVTNYQVKYEKTDSKLVTPTQLGYEQVVIEDGNVIIKGIWEESTADLFSLATLGDESRIIYTPYTEQISFMIAFVLDLSRKLGTDPYHTWNKVFQNKVMATDQFKTAISEAYRGSNGEKVMARGLFKLLSEPNLGRPSVGNPDAVRELAEVGGFGDEFNTIHNKITTDSLKVSDYIPGISGVIRSYDQSSSPTACNLGNPSPI